MMDDSSLLRSYAEDRSETAFAEIVRRHLDFVYSSALRQVNGDAHLAHDVTQVVFTDLARKASRVAAHPVLAGWLFTSTRYASAKLVRAARRREAREREALLMQTNPEPDIDWERIRPVLDEALAELDERDREAILLRYIGGHDFAEVGARLSLSANAARMRVDRAIDKLRGLLAQRGATSTAGALAIALVNQAVSAAPAGLAASVTGTAIAGTGVAAATLTFMSLTKLQLTLAGVVIVAGTGLYSLQARQNAALRAELAGLPDAGKDIARLRLANADLERTIRQAKTFQVSPAELAQLQAAVNTKQEALKAAAKASQARRPASQKVSVSYADPAIPLPQLDQMPVMKYQAPPAYPVELAVAGIEGSVVVSFIITTDGKVVGAEAIKSTHPGFEASAVAAIEQWQFKAGTKNGRQVNARVSQLIEYKLGASPQTPALWF
jgi:RNA polymerase sigma factor (sigma-70 family)